MMFLVSGVPAVGSVYEMLRVACCYRLVVCSLLLHVLFC